MRFSDAIAYLAHDIGDAIRAGVLAEEDLPVAAREVLGTRNSQRIDSMVRNVVEASWACAGYDGSGSPSHPPHLAMSSETAAVVNELREFMFETVYLPEGYSAEGKLARRIVEFLYEEFLRTPSEIPERYFVRGEGVERVAADYIAGMTDQFALLTAEGFRPGIASDIFKGRI